MSEQPKPSKQNTRPQRRKVFREELEKLNALVWERDGGQCIICGSGRIYGKRGKSGANHILSRGAHPELALDIRDLDLLCVDCHAVANTEEMVRKQFKIMQRYGYDYSELPYRYYVEEK